MNQSEVKTLLPISRVHQGSPCSEFCKIFGVRTVRSKWGIRSVRCSDCSPEMNSSVCSVFGLFARNELFRLFARKELFGLFDIRTGDTCSWKGQLAYAGIITFDSLNKGRILTKPSTQL